MTGDERLAVIVTALESVGVTYLVKGGHAVRFYGLHRDTNDFDFHLAPDRWAELPELLSRTPLFSTGRVVESDSWRPHAFRRFQLGRLPDGQVELVRRQYQAYKQAVEPGQGSHSGGAKVSAAINHHISALPADVTR